MRPLIALPVLLAACSQQPPEPSLTTGTFAGQGRDRLCIAGDAGTYRAGLIAFAPSGNANCSASGRLEPAGSNWVLIPKGEGSCRIPLSVDGKFVLIGEVPADCSYYCGPGASLAGKEYHRADMAVRAVDVAGDPLC